MKIKYLFIKIFYIVLTKMDYKYLSLVSTILCFIGYIPEIYFLLHFIYTKKIVIGKNDMWIIWILSSLFSAIYAFTINDIYIIIYSLTCLFLNSIIFILRTLQKRIILRLELEEKSNQNIIVYESV